MTQTEAPAPAKDPGQKFTFRMNGGKAHRGLRFADGFEVAVCSCPGSQNGRLIKGGYRIAEGWEAANCGN